MLREREKKREKEKNAATVEGGREGQHKERE